MRAREIIFAFIPPSGFGDDQRTKPATRTEPDRTTQQPGQDRQDAGIATRSEWDTTRT